MLAYICVVVINLCQVDRVRRHTSDCFCESVSRDSAKDWSPILNVGSAIL